MTPCQKNLRVKQLKLGLTTLEWPIYENLVATNAPSLLSLHLRNT